MKAVNLIPADERRGGAGGNGRSGGMVYVLLAGLGVVLVAALAYALANKSINDNRAGLASVTAKADAVQAQADDLRAYVRFSQLRQKRVDTVNSLVASRFDWSHSMHEISRVIPKNAWLTAMKGTSAPAAAGSTIASPPSIEVAGCTTSQHEVARMMARMRLIDGVAGVQLNSSQKSGCGDSDKFPAFQMVVSYNAPAASAAAPTTPSTAPQGATTP